MQGLRRSLFLITLPLATFGCLSSMDTAKGQIIPDNSLGAEKSVVNTVDVDIPIDLIYGGATRGKNLFHSFREFNVGEGRGAAFYNPTGIENILSRVTGKNPSNIFGLLGVGGNANLFLINPNGIVFGPNARLLMGGSFLASTANSLVFDNGFEFSSTNPQAPPILTVNIPIGLQFRDNPASITNRFVADADNVELQVASGKTLSLVGGDISLDRGRLTAAGGQVTLGSLAGAGTVGLNSDGSLSFPNGVARGNVSLTNGAQVDVTAGGGGSVNIYAHNLDILGNSPICAGIGATSTCGNRASDVGSVENKAGDVTLNAFGILTIQGSQVENNVNPNAIGSAGDIKIKASSMNMRDRASLSSSTYGKQDTTGQLSRAGKVSLEVGDGLSLENSSNIFNNVEYGGVGQGGDVQIKAGSLSLLNGSQIQTLVRETENNQPPRRGNAGKVNIDVRDAVTIAGVGKDKKPSAVFSAVNTGVIGNSGDIYIMARSMNMRDGATLSSSTYGKQDTTGQLSRAGIISLQVDDALTISGTSNDINRYPSSINSILGQGAIGKGGDINIQAGSLTVKDGARIDSSTAGQQDTSGQPSRAGDVNINVQGTINFSGYTTQMLDGSKQQFYSGISSQVYLGAIGNGGNITIQAGSLSMNDCCSVISNATSGQGNAGKVSVKVDDFIQLADLSNIRSNVEPGGIGVGGDIDIQARSLTLTDGSQILAAVMRQGSGSSAGRGKAGNININATDFVNISGVSSTQYPFADSLNPSKILLTAGYSSGLFASAERGTTAIDIKASGDIKITTGNFLLTNGAVVNTLTSNTGNGGKITINAKTLTATGGGQLLTTTRGSGRAGDISLNISDGITLSGIDPNFNERLTRVEQTIKNSSLNELPRDIVNNQGSASGIFANTSPDSVGDAGTISIDPRTLVIRDRAGIGVNSQGKGKGGNIEINSGNLTLDNNAFISANTASNQGGDIFLTIGDLLLLRRNSNISTNAGTDQAGGDGGNIKIDSDFIAALSSENSDITADAFTGRGGRVEITAKGIFGIKPRNYQTQRSDITASSEFGITGTVTLNTPNVDPSHGLVELPKNVVDPTEQIAQNPCQRGVGSKFIITGRGGLPPSPNEATSSDAVRVDLVEPAPGGSRGAREQRRSTSATLSGQGTEEKRKSSVAKSIVPAQGWIFDKNGEVMLTGYDPTGAGSQRPVNSDVCPVP